MILGHTLFRAGDQLDDTWGPAKLRGILAVLLLHPNQSISFETMVDWVWPEDQAPERDNTFHTYANRIRSALSTMDDPPALTARNRAYRLEVDRQEIDYFQFRQAIDQADAMSTAGEHESVVALLSSALRLWSGLPLADAKGERAMNFRSAAESTQLIHAHETLMRSLSALSRHDEVLRRWADLPLEQQSNLTLVKRRLAALHGSGLHNERITFHLETRKRLQADFNHDEADDLKRFHDELARTGPSPPKRIPAPSPAPETPSRRAPRLLPHDITDFAGRTDLLGQLDAAVATASGEPPAGILLLAGAPGIGKTSLVVHWAHRVASRFPGGVLYADLNGFSGGLPAEPTEVVNSFLATFGYPIDRITHAAGRAAKLRSLQAERRTLVILDNAAGADAVLPVLDCLTDSLVLITSRRGISRVTRRGASTVRVPPMIYEETVAWLARHLGQRATRESAAVADLATTCAGSPLALRSVADHVTARPGVRLAEFAEELRVTPNLLSLGDDGDGSESSIRTVFSWSYRALPAEEQRMFRLLGLHPGPDISLEAAAALGGRHTETVRHLLDALVHANLLTQPHSRNRYRFHDLIRHYAGECVAAECQPDERASAETRLFDFFVHSAIRADQIVFPFRPEHPVTPLSDGVAPLRFDSDEQAMAWCARERPNLMSLAHHAERSGRYEYALRLPAASVEIMQHLGYYDDVVRALIISAKAARKLTDLQGEADAVSNLGFIQVLLRDYVSAETSIRAAGDLYERIDDVVGGAMVLHYLARLRLQQGRIAEGINLNRAALTKMRGHGAEGLEVNILNRLGEAYRHAHDLSAAASWSRDGLWLAERLGDEHGQARCLTELSAIAAESGDLVLAKGYCLRALPVHERLHDHNQAGKTYNVLSVVHRIQGNLAEAERCARRATVSCRQARNAADELIAYEALGQALHARGWATEAAGAWSKALAIAVDIGDPLAAVLSNRLGVRRAIDDAGVTTPLESPSRGV
jgi:DNA-binding SARP family transcriptional activator/tetratricopeptide (TPR) repeat protein